MIRSNNMPRRGFGIRSLVAALAVVLMSGTMSQAIDLITPTGLNPGDSFRFIFVSSSQVTRSSSLSTLQTTVTNDASGYTYNGQSVNWKLVGSQNSPRINAKDYIDGYNTNVPVYLVTGDKVANDLTTASGGLWSGSLLHAINAGITGTTISSNILTGTNATGDLASSLGGSAPTWGNSDLTTGGWVNSGYTNSGPFRVYGISENLTATVPEPSTYALAAIATGVMAAVARRRRARKA